jgi:hypothetical protein
MKTLRRLLPNWSTKLVFVLAVIAMFACAFLNTESYFDVYWVIGTGLIAAVITYLIIAPKLLPITDTREEYLGAYRVFQKHLFGGQPSLTLVRDGKVVSTTQSSTTHTHIPGEDEEYEWYPRGVIVTDGTSVMALRTGTGISRVVGPGTERGQSPSGVIFTNWYETIDTIVDLRPQLRLILMNDAIPMQTRDGISIGARAIASFTLKGTKPRRMCDLAKVPMRYPLPFTWRGSSVWQVVNSKRIERRGDKDKKTEWGDRVMGLAIPRLRQIIARYTVDYLTAPLTLPRHPRFAVRDELRETVKRELEGDEFNPQSGLEIRFMSVPIMWPPQKVVAQRIESWKSEWHKKETEILGRAEADVIRTREQARAQVQGEMTARINDALKEAKASGTNNSDLITLRFLEAMEKMAKDPTTRALLTLDSLKILKQLREMLMPAQPDGSKDSSQ